MGKYIEAEVFKAKIMNYGIIHEGDHIPIPFYKEHCGKMFTELLRWVCEEVDDALPADAAEVRHGRLVRGDEMADYPRVPYNPWETYCSCCGEIMEQSHDNFCGNCGAKMDGE